MSTKIDNSYDSIAYQSEPFPLSRPSHLAVLSKLFGIESAPADRASVLELGCASGNNIIPLAYLNPNSLFLGVDSSQSQIKIGENLISELGIKNIRLVCTRVEDFKFSESFDYIICHGMFSWVKKQTQEKILEICNGSLSQNGVAYISYNALPGWHLKSIIRDAMQFHTRNVSDPKQKLLEARAYLNFLAFATRETAGPYHEILKSSAKGIESLPDWYIFHDFLEEENHPIYVSEFIDRIQGGNLAYLCDADVTQLAPQEFSLDIQLALRKVGRDPIHLEQTTDFLRNQLFRRSVICRKEVKFSRDPQTSPIENFYISSPLCPISDQNGIYTFQDPISGSTLQTKDPVFVKTLEILKSIWPGSVSYSELSEKSGVGQTETLLNLLLRAHLAGAVFFDPLPPQYVTTVSDQPLVFEVARAMEKLGASVVNIKHESIELDDILRKVVALADGNRTREEIESQLQIEIGALLEQLSQHSLLSSAAVHSR